MSPPEAQSVSDPLPDWMLRRRVSSGRETCRPGADTHKEMEFKTCIRPQTPGEAEGSSWPREGALCVRGDQQRRAIQRASDRQP